jgi:hypothetical protein
MPPAALGNLYLRCFSCRRDDGLIRGVGSIAFWTVRVISQLRLFLERSKDPGTPLASWEKRAYARYLNEGFPTRPGPESDQGHYSLHMLHRLCQK